MPRSRAAFAHIGGKSCADRVAQEANGRGQCCISGGGRAQQTGCGLRLAQDMRGGREPDITMPELAEALRQEHDLGATQAMLSRHLIHRLGVTYKKSLIATQRLRKRVSAARYEWRNRRMPRMRLEPHRRLFIVLRDIAAQYPIPGSGRTGGDNKDYVTTKMTRLRGQSPLGMSCKARTFDALFQSVKHTRQLFPPEECRKFFNAAGYVAD